MKRMLRWRFRRCIASLLVLALTFPLGEGMVARVLAPAAQAAAARQQSVVVFEFANKSKYGAEAFGSAFTRQVRLAMEQSPTFDLVEFSAVPPYGASIDRAIRDGQLTAQELAGIPDVATALKITRILGADLAVVGEIDEDGYDYNAAEKRVSVRALCFMYGAGSDTPLNSISVTGTAQGDLGQGALTQRAVADAARQIEAKLSGRAESAGTGGKKKPGARKLWPYVAGIAIAAVVAVSLFGGKESKGPSAPAGAAVTLSGTRDGVRLTWTPVPGADSYRIYRAAVSTVGAQSSALPYQAVAEVPAGTVQYDDRPPAAGNVRYAYRVVAVGGGKEGAALQSDRAVAPGEPSQVSGLQATVNQRTIQVSWAANPEDFVTAYRIYRSSQMTEGYTKIAEVSSSTRTYADSGLAGGVTYFYKVSAVGASGQESNWQAMTAVARSTDVRPAAPTGVTATTTQGVRRVVLSWRANTEPDLLYYEVHRGSRVHRSGGNGVPVDIFSKFPRKGASRSGSWVKYRDHIAPTASPSIIDDNVDFNTTYYYVVRAVSAQGESAFSEEVSATPNAVPGAVQSVRAQAGDGKVTLTWGASAEPDISGYNVYRQVAGQATTRTKLNSQLLTVLTYVDSTAVNDTTYEYFVTAVDTARVEGPLSVPVTATPTAPPEAPRNVKATAGSGRVTLMWDRNTETNLREYRVYRSDSPTATFPTPYAVVPASASDPTAILYSDEAATNGTTYHYEVTAVNTSGVESARSTKVSATPGVPPAAPTQVQAVAGDRSVTVTWNAVTTLADGQSLLAAGKVLRSYRIYRIVASTGAKTLVEDVSLSSLAGQPKYEDKRAPTGIGLRYAVTATMLDNTGGVLESAEGVQADPTPVVVIRRLPAVTNLTGVGDDNKVVLSWTAATDPSAYGYVVYAATSQGGPYVRLFEAIRDGAPTLPVSTTTFTVDPRVWSELQNDKPFWFRVAAVDRLGIEGFMSNEVKVIPNPVPPTPLDLQATNQGPAGPLDMSIALTWKAPAVTSGTPIYGYRVYRAQAAGGPFELITPDPLIATPSPSFVDEFKDGLIDPAQAAGRDFYYRVVSVVQYPVAGFVESRPAGPAGPVRLVNVPPGTVQNVMVSAAGGVVTVRWNRLVDAQGNAVRDLARYEVSRREKGDTTGATEVVVTVSPEVTEYFDTQVTAGKAYVYRVRGVDAVEPGPWSAEREITP